MVLVHHTHTPEGHNGSEEQGHLSLVHAHYVWSRQLRGQLTRRLRGGLCGEGGEEGCVEKEERRVVWRRRRGGLRGEDCAVM